jgi:hypothetical protein
MLTLSRKTMTVLADVALSSSSSLRLAYLGALKFYFHGLLVERRSPTLDRAARVHLWTIAKFRAARYVDLSTSLETRGQPL